VTFQSFSPPVAWWRLAFARADLQGPAGPYRFVPYAGAVAAVAAYAALGWAFRLAAGRAFRRL